MYHRKCWNDHVTNVLRQKDKVRLQCSVSEEAAEIEFLSLVKHLLFRGEILPMAEIESTYTAIRESNGVVRPEISRKKIKTLLVDTIQDVEFSKPNIVTQSERTSLKVTKDKALLEAEERWDEGDDQDKMNVIYKCAKQLRKLILQSTPWIFHGDITDEALCQYVPSELYCFFRWLISGPQYELCKDNQKKEVINKKAMNLAQSTMFSCLSKRQVMHNKIDGNVRHTRELPLQLAIGITVHRSCRSRKLVDLLNSFSMSVDYKRILRLENQIANQVIRSMNANGGVYYPHNFIEGRHIFFAIDNCDFSEDTPDGKFTLHGTAMAIYQRKFDYDPVESFTIDPDIEVSKLEPLPERMTTLLPCYVPTPCKPPTPIFSNYQQKMISVWNHDGVLQDFAWAAAVSHMLDVRDDTLSIPTWKAFNSRIGTPLPLTRVATPPILPVPAHEWCTLLTVLKQAEDILVQACKGVGDVQR